MEQHEPADEASAGEGRAPPEGVRRRPACGAAQHHPPCGAAGEAEAYRRPPIPPRGPLGAQEGRLADPQGAHHLHDRRPRHDHGAHIVRVRDRLGLREADLPPARLRPGGVRRRPFAGSSAAHLYWPRWARARREGAPGLLPLPAEAGPGPLPGTERRGPIVNDEQNPNDEELRDALEAAAVLDDDALARVEVATQVAKAAEAAEDQAVAEGDFAEAERIDEQADEGISELVVEAVVEAETAEDVVE